MTWRMRAIFTATIAAWAGNAVAQTPGDALLALINANVKQQAQGALAMLGFSMIPSETASTVVINNKRDGDTAFLAGQFGGAFTVSEGFPLYLEGFIGYARYDPKFVLSDGTTESVLPVRWNAVSASGGVGWDFRLAPEWVLRPMVNVALGHVESDASLIGRLIERETGAAIDFLEDGRMSAYGYGGAVMLDFERKREAYEADVELRYSHLRIESFDASVRAVEGGSVAQTLGLWSRLRVPTGYEAFGGPIRAVGEFSFGWYPGDQSLALDSPWLGQIGAGGELDFEAVSWVPISRGRLTGRFLFGEGVTGFSVGLGASF